MKSSTPDLMKFKRLQRMLRCSVPELCGYLELLWICAQKNAPQGDIGKFSDEEICIACYWEGDPAFFVDSLVECGWLDRHKKYRLVVHDWADHAPRWVVGNLARHGREIISANISEEPDSVESEDSTEVTRQLTNSKLRDGTSQPTKQPTKQATKQPTKQDTIATSSKPSQAKSIQVKRERVLLDPKVSKKTTLALSKPDSIDFKASSVVAGSTQGGGEGFHTTAEENAADEALGVFSETRELISETDTNDSAKISQADIRQAWERWKLHLRQQSIVLTQVSEEAALMALGRSCSTVEDQIEAINFSILKRARNLILNGDHRRSTQTKNKNQELFESIFGQ